MRRQFQWASNSLIDTGLLVGLDCLDVPQQQFRAPILPADPIPRVNPRPSPNVTGIPIIGQPLPTTPANQGFTQYTLGAASPGLYPTTKSAVLSAVAQNSGVVTPGLVMDQSLPVMPLANVSTLLMPAQPARSWLLLFNPTASQAQVALGTTATWGVSGFSGNLILGPGEAYFWSTAQGLQPAYAGAVSVVGLLPGVPFWAWQSAGSTVLSTDEYGNIDTDEFGNWIATDLPGPQTGFVFTNNSGVLGIVPGGCGPWPRSALHLSAGSVYNDALTVKVVSGVAPSATAAPVYFGQITPDGLLALGGGNLPLLPPVAGSNQLWNNAGTVCIA